MLKKAAIKHQQSSGNVFADVGLPGEYLAKAELVSKIDSIIAERKLTQTKAAKLMGVDQPRVSALLSGKLSLFSLDKLLTMVSGLGNKIEIAIKESPNDYGITVVATDPVDCRYIPCRIEALETPASSMADIGRLSISAEQIWISGASFPYWAMTEDRKSFYNYA
jgi:predicted XRE-type DNA-binding protein